MEAWSNIQVEPQDPEIANINAFEKKLGHLPDKVLIIRELITRFEVCHFKYQQHLGRIKDSIFTLDTDIKTEKIGQTHIRHGESVLNKDTTGKSVTGQQYVWAMEEWLKSGTDKEYPEIYDVSLGQQVHKKLGEKNPEKIRLVRLLMARLTWDWKICEELQTGSENTDIENQACRIDICHYTFPKNLDLLLTGIGQMTAADKDKFEGCGSFNPEIRSYLENEFSVLLSNLISLRKKSLPDRNDLIKIWLIACLIKTIKENLDISTPITFL